jgi:formylglycine-generating enzyme required for sulfatase activity
VATNSTDGQVAEPTAKIFISYSRKDLAFADRLEVALKARGFEPLIDRAEIYAFEDWWQRIQALIGRADTIVFVLSPDAVTSDVALKEVAHASALNKRFAPIVARRVEDAAVPEPLRRLNFIFFDDPACFEVSADKLGEALATDIGWVRQHTEFGEAARRWVAAGRSHGLLLRSPALDLAEYWISSRPRDAPVPNAETEEFVAESRKGALSAQRNRRLVQSAIYVLLLGIIAGLVGWINQAYIKEQWTWYAIMRPYAMANFRPYVLTAAAERALKPQANFRECAGAGNCPEMIVIPSGSFVMGSTPAEQNRFDALPKRVGDNDVQNHEAGGLSNEGPQHTVVIAKPFAVSKFDVTFAEWDACFSVGGCRQKNDSYMGRGAKPAITVSWVDAQQYVAWLSKMTGRSYRLLTEAEWEYAARAGTTTAYYWGDEIGKGNANCMGCGNEAKQTSPVGSFPANRFGLYDMAGNVWQWVEDCYGANYDAAPTDGSASTGQDCVYRVARGGSWNLEPEYVRSAIRFRFPSTYQAVNRGFRVARTLDQ